MLIETLYQEFESKLKREYVPRELAFAGVPQKIDVALGVRRSGKTFFLYQAIDGLIARGVPKESILYLNFEDDRLFPLDAAGAGQLVDSFFSLFPENHHRECFLFLDEIHSVDNWAKLVRRLHDSINVRLFLAGSSARLLSKEIATELRGRSLATEIWPFSFPEYLRATGQELEARVMGRASYDQAFKRLLEYFEVGGFPEVVDLEAWQRRRILQDYVDVVIFRDIVERHNITNIGLAKYLSRVLLRSVGRRLSINKLYNDLKSQGRKVSKDALYEYVGHFEDAYLTFQVPAYSSSERLRQTSPKKIYAVDPGICAAFNINAQNDWGQLFENLVYLDLRREGAEVYHVMTEKRYEVDFLTIDRNGGKRLIQACFDASDPITLAREERALREAERELGIPGELITPEEFFRRSL